MTLKRNYLTSQEIATVVASMIQKEYSVEREIVKVGLVAQLLIEDLGEYDNCDDIYDVVMENNIDFTQVSNYYIIDYLVEQEIGIEKVLKDFVNIMNDKVVEAVNKLDLNGAIKQLGEISNVGNGSKPKTNKVRETK